MANPWATVRLSSVLYLSSCSSGDKRNLILPDPPDPQAQLSQVQYPPLSPSLPSSNRLKVSVSSTDYASSLSSSPTGQKRSAAGPLSTNAATSNPTSTSETTVARSTVKVRDNHSENFTVLPPKSSSPIQTNRTSSSSLPNPNPILPLPSSATTSSPELEAPSQTHVLSGPIPSSSSHPPPKNPKI
ncbi:unnamed protein product [Brassica oleracea]